MQFLLGWRVRRGDRGQPEKRGGLQGRQDERHQRAEGIRDEKEPGESESRADRRDLETKARRLTLFG